MFLLVTLSSAAAGYTVQFADESKNIRLRWKKTVIPIHVSQSLTKQIQGLKTDFDAVAAVKKSLGNWEKIAGVKFEVAITDKNSVSATGRTGDGVNLITIAQTTENLLPFNGGSEETAARTQVFYNGRGFITEADIVLNPYEQFSVDGALGTFDLESTLTHEIGHLLGLEHSLIPGATMFEHQGKNGAYGVPNFAPRTLAEDDIAGIRALYGTKNAGTDCCGSVYGKISSTNGKIGKIQQIWLEQAATGRVTAGALTNADGGFRLDALPADKYFIYAQQRKTEKNAAAGRLLGEIEIVKGKTVDFSRKLNDIPKNFDITYIGFNGQLQDLAVPVSSGGSFLIYVGGRNLDAEKLKIGFNSRNFTVVADSLNKQDFGGEVSVISFEIKVNSQTPPGEYSFFLRGKNDETAFVVGALTVDGVAGLPSIPAFFETN